MGMGTGARRRWAPVAAVVALSLGVAACSDDPAPSSQATTTSRPAAGGSTSTSAHPADSGSTAPTSTGSTTTRPIGPAAPVAAVGTYPVGETHVALVDLTRDTPGNGDFDGSDGRKLPTLVWYPAAGAASADRTRPTITDGAPARPGRYPLVVFGHGVTGRADLYTSSLAAFASAGYVVVAPDFPLSNADSPGGPTVDDVGHQPADLSFLIDRFTGRPLATGKGTASAELATVVRSVDPERVVVGGHSLGAISALGAGYATCCADRRVDAVFDWAGGFYPLLEKPSPDPDIHDRPLLIVHGDRDETVPYAKARDVFARAKVPRWFVTLVGGGHVPAYLAGYAQPQSKLVIETTVRFLDAELKGDASGLTDLAATVKAAGPKVATLRTAGQPKG